MMGREDITLILVGVLCALIFIIAIAAASVYFCCRLKKRPKIQPTTTTTRYPSSDPESTDSQSTSGHQDESSPPQLLPKVGSSGLWMSKPVMHAQVPNDTYQLNPNGIREPVMPREIGHQPMSGYIYEGANPRVYYRPQIPGLVGSYGEPRGAYYNEAFIYPTYVDAEMSRRSNVRFPEASGYYAPEHLTRENHAQASRHQVKRGSPEVRVSTDSGDLRQSSAKPSRYQPESPQCEPRNSRPVESSSKNKSVSSIIERSGVHEATNCAAGSSTPANESTRGRIGERRPSHRDEDVRSQTDGKTEADVATTSIFTQPEPDISLETLRESKVSQRALDVIHYPDPLLSYVTEVKKNLYKPKHNENGIVEIGLGESKLCEDLIQEKLTELLPTKVELDDLYYFTNYGSISFRTAIKNFLNKFFNPLNPIDEDNLVVVTGVTCILDLVADGLAEEGDCFLCPAPYYSRIRNDIFDKSQVTTYDVDISETDPDGQIVYRITQEKLQIAYKEAQNKGLCIKGIIVINPNNPSGKLLTKEEIYAVLQFSKINNIHAIFDEIYGLSIHSQKNVFSSVCSVESLDPEKTHFMWGLSKDLGLAGFRCGVLHTTNKELLNFVRKLAFYSAIPLFVQRLLASLLNQTEWLEDTYFPILHDRLKNSYEIATERLKKLGVTIYPSDGGFFVWANFSKFMPDKSFKCEDDLFKLFFKHKVFFSQGSAFYSKEPGWFRIIFTQSLEILQVGLDRIEQALTSIAGYSEK